MVVILLSLAVAIPLTIKVYLDKGGPWGFGIIGFPILIPLSFCILFGLVGLIRSDAWQRKAFMAAHLITFVIGAIVLFIFPVYPALLVSIPLFLALIGLLSRSKFRYCLSLMLFLTMMSNVLLLKWELDFHRSIPIIQLFASGTEEPL
ncbi:MAG: hypothetical protein ACOYXT_17590 [Bacteroidota bacterium]